MRPSMTGQPAINTGVTATDYTTGTGFSQSTNTEFVFGFEARAQAAYQVTNAISVRGGIDVIDFANGYLAGSQSRLWQRQRYRSRRATGRLHLRSRVQSLTASKATSTTLFANKPRGAIPLGLLHLGSLQVLKWHASVSLEFQRQLKRDANVYAQFRRSGRRSCLRASLATHERAERLLIAAERTVRIPGLKSYCQSPIRQAAPHSAAQNRSNGSAPPNQRRQLGRAT